MRKILMIDDDRLQFRLTQMDFTKLQGKLYELKRASTDEDAQLWRPAR